MLILVTLKFLISVSGININNIENQITGWKNGFEIYITDKVNISFVYKALTFTRERQPTSFSMLKKVSDIHTHSHRYRWL